jgi:chemotaxis protein CheX
MLDDQEIIASVRTAAADVFTTMLGMDIEPGPARVEQSAPAVSDGVLSLIGLAGAWAGAGTVCCSSRLACRICAQLLMTEATSVNEEVLDAVGEVTNMIIGNFKTMAEERLGPLGLSIPTVIFGRNFTSRSIGRDAWIVLPFRCDGEEFEVRVCLAPAKEPTCIRHGYLHHHSLGV